jgi:energy-converting hydrogenase Eha subunit A
MLAYREQDPGRARLAEQQRQVAGWLATMEATRAHRGRRHRRSLSAWLLIVTGPLVGASAAALAASAIGVHERLVLELLGAVVGFVAAIVVALRVALARRDGLEP